MAQQMKNTKITKTSAIAIGTALAGIIVSGVVLTTPHTVRIVPQSDSQNFTASTKTMKTTMFKSLSKSLADQDSDVLPENVDGFTYTGCTDKDGKPFNINKRNPIVRGTTLHYNYKETLEPVAFVEDNKVSLVRNESVSQTVDASQVIPAFAESHPYDDFTGWTETTPDAVQGVISTADEAVKIYEAQWTPKTFNITYDYDGGYADGNPDTYQYGVGVDAIQDASKSGYTFDGWFDDAGNQVSSIAKDAHDDIHLTARYTAIPVAKSYTPSANSGWSYSAPVSNSNQSNGSSQSSGGFAYWGSAGAISFNTGYSAGLNWGMTQGNVDLPNIAAIDSFSCTETSDESAWSDNADGTRTWGPVNISKYNYYGIADHDNQGGNQAEWASTCYLSIGGQNLTLHKLDMIYDDADGHYGYPEKYEEHAKEIGATAIFQTCTATGVVYVFWG